MLIWEACGRQLFVLPLLWYGLHLVRFSYVTQRHHQFWKDAGKPLPQVQLF